MRILPLLLVVLTSACTSVDDSNSPQARTTAHIAAAHPAGPPVDCIETTRIRSTRVLDDRTIDFELRGGTTMRNVLPAACPGLGFNQAISYKTSLPRLCSVDTITVVDQGGTLNPGATCGLGPFQPVVYPR